MRDVNGLSYFTFLGILLLVIGVILILIPFIYKLGLRPENIHPLILVWRKMDGFYIGTSPIAILILIIVYLFLVFIRRGYLT